VLSKTKLFLLYKKIDQLPPPVNRHKYNSDSGFELSILEELAGEECNVLSDKE
jgi:hypothetical protein